MALAGNRLGVIVVEPRIPLDIEFNSRMEQDQWLAFGPV